MGNVTFAGAELMRWALDVVLKVTVLLAIAGLVAALLRRAPAATRHALWAAALVGILLIPLASAAPGWRILPAWFANRAALPVAVPPPPAEAASAPIDAPSAPRDADSVASPPPEGLAPPAPSMRGAALPAPLPDIPPHTTPAATLSRATPMRAALLSMSWPAWVVVAWAGGAAAMLLPLFLAAVALRRLQQTAEIVTIADGRQALERVRKAMRVRRKVRLLTADSCVVPMTFGIFHPRVVVPANHVQWSAERWRMILTHEMAHIRRLDVGVMWCGQLARAIYWFHPLAWVAYGRLGAESEFACDQGVLEAGLEPRDYAAVLLDIAEASRTRRVMQFASLQMSRMSSLEDRIRAVLKGRRRGAASKWALPVIVAVGLLVAAIAMLRPIQQPTEQPSQIPPTSGKASAMAPAVALTSAPEADVSAPSASAPARATTVPVAATTATVTTIAATAAPDGNPAVNLKQTAPDGKRVELAAEHIIWNAPASVGPAVAIPKPVVDAIIAIAAAHADDTSAIEAEQAVRDDKQLAYNRLLAAGDGATQASLAAARMDVVVANARVKLMEATHKQDKLEVEHIKAMLAASHLPPMAQIAGTPVPTTEAEAAAALAIAQERAKDMTGVEVEDAILADKQLQYQRLLQTGQAVAQASLDEARVDVTVAQARVKLAQQQHELDVLALNLAQAEYDAIKNGTVIGTPPAREGIAAATSGAEADALLAIAKDQANDMSALEEAEAAVDGSKKLLELTTQKEKVGVAPVDELLQTQMQLAQAQARLDAAQHQHGQAVLALKVAQAQYDARQAAATQKH